MRIISGKLRGLILKAPKTLDVRPTPDLVRQAIFNSLGVKVQDADVLELFGGTAALSLEALSRGARHATCIEISPRHAKFIKENFLKTGLPSEVFRLIVDDVYACVIRFSEQNFQFDLIFADPPFGEKTKGERSESHSQRLLDNPCIPRLLKPDGLFVLGHAKRDQVEIPPPWRELKTLKHGDSWIRILRV